MYIVTDLTFVHFLIFSYNPNKKFLDYYLDIN